MESFRRELQREETQELVKVVKLDSKALAEAREEALKLESRANVYGDTPPAERRRSTPSQ